MTPETIKEERQNIERLYRELRKNFINEADKIRQDLMGDLYRRILVSIPDINTIKKVKILVKALWEH